MIEAFSHCDEADEGRVTSSPKYCSATEETGLRTLVAIVGPTGAGKSELGLCIAEQLDGEIVNCDSMQMYRGFDIGTAKMPITGRRGIAHHLIDVADPEAPPSAGEYGRMARAVVLEIASRGKTPVVVGGTGFYLRALLDGLPELPGRDAELRARLLRREERRSGSLWKVLRRLDGESAERIHARDVPKVVRALEIRMLTGQGRAEASTEKLEGFQVTKIGLFPPRAELYRRVEERTEQMFARGLVEEVRGLLGQGVSPLAKPFEAIGYRQALAVVKGEMNAGEAVRSAQMATRRYAKRQVTWFRGEENLVRWEGFGGQSEIRTGESFWSFRPVS